MVSELSRMTALIWFGVRPGTLQQVGPTAPVTAAACEVPLPTK